MNAAPRIIAWELTRQCSLHCRHCRGDASSRTDMGEFSTAECFRTIDAMVRMTKPMLILTGGEPLMRKDFFEVANYATQQGCRVVLATCGCLLSPRIVAQLASSGVLAVSVSLDAATADAHDAFRGRPGAHAQALRGVTCLRAAGMPFQINTTVSKLNVTDLPQMLAQAVALGAAAMDFFFLVPTGRGAALADLALDPAAQDQTLQWIAHQERTAPLRIRTTCAPRYHRFRLPTEPEHPSAPFHGCMGGRGFVFLSHTGRLQPCGFLNLPCGELRAADFDFAKLYRESEGFQKMRRLNPFDECPARMHAQTGQ